MTEENMAQATVQDWTESNVVLKYDEHRDVKYRVYREGEALFQETANASTSDHTRNRFSPRI
jgi:hypothetical protein